MIKHAVALLFFSGYYAISFTSIVRDIDRINRTDDTIQCVLYVFLHPFSDVCYLIRSYSNEKSLFVDGTFLITYM